MDFNPSPETLQLFSVNRGLKHFYGKQKHLCFTSIMLPFFTLGCSTYSSYCRNIKIRPCEGFSLGCHTIIIAWTGSSTLSLQRLSPLLSPNRLHSGGSVRCSKASARLWSIFSHSCRGMWHSFSNSAPSVPSSWPTALTRNWAMSKAKSWTKHICSEDRWWTRPSGLQEHRVTTTDSQRSWAGEGENTERKMRYKS